MNQGKSQIIQLIYLACITSVSVGIVLVNSAFKLHMVFRVEYLIGFIGLLLIHIFWHGILTHGWKQSLLIVGIIILVSLIAEALGVNYGLVFGKYRYSSVLGISLFHVPILVVLAWVPIVYASWLITDILSSNPTIQGMNNSQSLAARTYLSLLGALAATSWDTMIDPIAVNAGWWEWIDGGPYLPHLAKGIPIQNFLGWIITSFLIHLIIRMIFPPTKITEPSRILCYYSPLLLYTALFLSAFCVVITILGKPTVAVFGSLTMGPFIIFGLAEKIRFRLHSLGS